MKPLSLASALFLTTAIVATASAVPSASIASEGEPQAEALHASPQRLAYDFFDGWRGEHRRHHRHHHDDDDDDDEGRDGHGRGHHAERDRGGARPADPNAADAPVPNNGVFNGKTRPKVEVQ